MLHSTRRGWPIESVHGDAWVYSDTKEPVGAVDGPCGKCGGADDHDKCLGMLPGVVNACCGHGRREDSYIQFVNGVTVRGFILEAEVL